MILCVKLNCKCIEILEITGNQAEQPKTNSSAPRSRIGKQAVSQLSSYEERQVKVTGESPEHDIMKSIM